MVRGWRNYDGAGCSVQGELNDGQALPESARCRIAPLRAYVKIEVVTSIDLTRARELYAYGLTLAQVAKRMGVA
jgi:hypothetical protein